MEWSRFYLSAKSKKYAGMVADASTEKEYLVGKVKKVIYRWWHRRK